jgi:uncharacterized protein (DUF169 family)
LSVLIKNNCERISNFDIAQTFKKYMKLKYHPLGVYFSDTKPENKVRIQGRIINMCITKHAFKAAKYGRMSIVQKGCGCVGGQWWSGFSPRAPKGLTFFLSKGREGIFGGRAERYKKDTKVASRLFKDPGPVILDQNTRYIVFRRLKEIPDEQEIEYVLFFIEPTNIAQFSTIANYSRHIPNVFRAPAGSGCMSILNYPLLMEEEEPDAIMGIWDMFARRFLPKNILSLSIRRWFAEDLANDIPESFLAYSKPYTLKGELKRLFKKKN